jgi:hypothetical protein
MPHAEQFHPLAESILLGLEAEEPMLSEGERFPSGASERLIHRQIRDALSRVSRLALTGRLGEPVTQELFDSAVMGEIASVADMTNYEGIVDEARQELDWLRELGNALTELEAQP